MVIKRVGVLGSGIMGSGVAEVAAKAGCEVIVRSRTRVSADGLLAGLARNLDRQVAKGKLTTDEQAEVQGRVSATDPARRPRRVRSRDRVRGRGPHGQEGALRRARSGRATGRHLRLQHLDPPDRRAGRADAAARPVAACTSSTRHRHAAGGDRAPDHRQRPDRRVRPRLRHRLPEGAGRGGRPRRVRGERPALPVPQQRSACWRTERRPWRTSTPRMQGGCNFPMAPFALLDLVGLDTSVSILDALYEEFRDPNYAAVPLLRRMRPPAGWAARPVRASTRTPADGGSRPIASLVDLDGAEAWDRRPLESPPTRWGSPPGRARRRGPGGDRWRPRAGDDPAGLSPGAVPHARRPTPPRLVVTGRARRHPARQRSGRPGRSGGAAAGSRVSVDRDFLGSSPTAPGPTAHTDGSRRRSSRPTPGCTSSAGPTASRPGPTRVSWPEGCTGSASAASSPVSRWCTSRRTGRRSPWWGLSTCSARERRLPARRAVAHPPPGHRWGRSPSAGRSTLARLADALGGTAGKPMG